MITKNMLSKAVWSRDLMYFCLSPKRVVRVPLLDIKVLSTV